MKGQLSRERARLEEALELAWLNLGDTREVEVANPLDNRTQFDKENPDLHLLRLIRRPEYFPFTCKHILNVEIFPFQHVILQLLWKYNFPMLIGSRGLSKTFLLAIYSLLRALLCQGSRVVLIGGAFRQAKMIFEYAETIWNAAPVLRSMVDFNDRRQGPRTSVDRVKITLGISTILGVPLADGSKIRGLRASNLILDETESVPEEVYEVVVAGFLATTSNPVQNAKQAARFKLLKEMKLIDNKTEYELNYGNQSIMAGTAGYSFKYFAKYWQRYKALIESKGRDNFLSDIIGASDAKKFRWKDFCVIRIPYDLLPEGLMDEKNILRQKATVNTGIFEMEYGAVFRSDSAGFYKRSLIEGCVTNQPIGPFPESGYVRFSAAVRGEPRGQYIFAIDPASEVDNFSIAIIELHPDHRRVVYCWTTTRASHKLLLRQGLVSETDFYGFCVRKIRNLMKVFPCVRIGLDEQGGGRTIEEALHDAKRMEPDEDYIWPVIDPEKPQDSDRYPGKHILELISFAKSEWVSWANHGMKKDFEDKLLLFPYFDTVNLALAIEQDKLANRRYDTLEDCVMEIEELKTELSQIVHTQTGVTMRDRWDTPEFKRAEGRKGRLRKDRYSALLMANAIARKLQEISHEPVYDDTVGGFAHTVKKEERDTSFYYGGVPTETLQQMNDAGCGMVVNRNQSYW